MLEFVISLRIPARRFLSQHGPLLSAFLIFIAGLAVYGYAVFLPYHIDDFVHFRWVSVHTLAQVWTSAAGLSYFRPLPFTIWELVRAWSGGFPPVVEHAINVVIHALNGMLLFELIRLHRQDASGKTLVAIIVAFLFLLFPFSYQAVPWVGSLTHPLVTFLMLGSMVAFIVGREKHRGVLVLLSLLLALLAPFANETGVLIAPLLTLFYLTLAGSTSLRRELGKVRIFWAFSLMAVLALFWLRSHSGLTMQPVDLTSRWQNAVYFLQGLAYPVAPLAEQLKLHLPGLSDLASVLSICLPALAILVWLSVRLGYARQVLFAVGWYVVAIAPAWLMLDFSYVVDGPRLMYEASPGATVLWALPAAMVLEQVIANPSHGKNLMAPMSIRRLWVGLAAATLLTIATLIGSVSFLTERADMYWQTRQATQGLLAAVKDLPDTKQPILSVNFPAWFAPKSPTYALGHEGVSFIPTYSSPIDLVWAMIGREYVIPNVVVHELQLHWRYNYLNYGRVFKLPDIQPMLRDARKVLFTSYRLNDLVTYDVGNLEKVNQPRPAHYLAVYSGTLVLVDGEWQREGNTLQVTLRWQSWLTLTQEVRTFVHLQDDSGALVAQEDGLPLMGVADPLWWQPGDQWRDMRVIVLPTDLRPGRYTLRAGVYPASGGNRFIARDPQGKRYPEDSATLGTLTIP